jgi:hypothetical protein
MKEDFRGLQIIPNLLGVLRTGHKATAAEYTFIRNDMGLVVGEFYGLYRAVTYTLIAVLAVRRF